MTNELAWQDDAACKNKPTKWFFEAEYEKLGKAVCSECPVQQTCLEFAIAIGEYKHGIWGGLPAEARRKIKRNSLPTVGKMVYKCDECGGEFYRTRESVPQRFCSHSCSNKFNNAKRRLMVVKELEEDNRGAESGCSTPQDGNLPLRDMSSTG